MNVRKLENSPANREIEADVRSRSRRVYRREAIFRGLTTSRHDLPLRKPERARAPLLPPLFAMSFDLFRFAMIQRGDLLRAPALSF